MFCDYIEYHIDSPISWIYPHVDSKDVVYFAMLFTLRENLRASDSPLLATLGFIKKLVWHAVDWLQLALTYAKDMRK